MKNGRVYLISIICLSILIILMGLYFCIEIRSLKAKQIDSISNKKENIVPSFQNENQDKIYEYHTLLQDILKGPIQVESAKNLSYENWKIYKNEKYKFEMKYPNDLDLTPEDNIVYFPKSGIDYGFTPLDAASDVIIEFKDKVGRAAYYQGEDPFKIQIVKINENYFYYIPNGGFKHGYGNDQDVYLPFESNIAIIISPSFKDKAVQMLYSFKKLN